MLKLCSVTKSRCRDYFLASVLENLVLAMHIRSQQMVVSLPASPSFPFFHPSLHPFGLPSCLLVYFPALFSNITSQIMPDSSDTSLEQTSCLPSSVSCLTCIHSLNPIDRTTCERRQLKALICLISISFSTILKVLLQTFSQLNFLSV